MEFKEQLINYVNQLISYEINLIDYAQLNKIPIYVNGNLNKGWKGNVIEHMLNLKQNSKKGSDYPDLEVKTVPIVIKENKKIIKETTCLSVIDVNNLIKTSFEDSDLYHKIKKTLFIFIDVSDESFPKIESTFFVNFQDYPEMLTKMEKDYNSLVEHILDNIYHDDSMEKNFSGKLGEVIQPRPKTGKNGDYTWAFYLKKDFLNKLINTNKVKVKFRF